MCIRDRTWVRDKTGSLGFIDEGEYTIYFTAQWYKPFKLTYDLNGGGEWVKDYDFGYTTDGVSDPVSMMVGAGETLSLIHISLADSVRQLWCKQQKLRQQHALSVGFPSHDQ